MAGIDTQAGQQEQLNSPADNATEVTPNDTTPLAYVSRGLYIGVTGNLSVTMQGGGNVTFVGLPAGTVLPVRVTHVRSSSTTASSIINLY
jgi:hypothetical protein